MMKRYNSFNSGEFDHINQKALYVEPPHREIDMNTVPDDGNEYIHKARLENSRLDFSRSDIETESSESRDVGKINKIRLRKAAVDFAHFANELKSQRESLRMKFPKTETIPVDNEIESCLFCLGSAKCFAIYECEPRLVVIAHLPFLRYVIHFSQQEIQKLLRYTYRWYKSIGMDEEIGKWVFALLACTDKPLTHSLEEFLVEYFDDFKAHLQACDEEEYQTVRILMSLMEKYFVLKPKQHDGEYLNQLLRLNH